MNYQYTGNLGYQRAKIKKGNIGTRIIVGIFLLTIFFIPLIGNALPKINPNANYPVVIVHQGDTLWKIALKYSSGKDIRQAVQELQINNGLTSSALQPGYRIRIPWEDSTR